MKKTKVVCTMGPNTNDKEVMRKLIQNGMDVARFNFSHGDHEEQKFRMDLLKELREEEHAHTAILLDTKGDRKSFARKNMRTQRFFWTQRDRKSVQVF